MLAKLIHTPKHRIDTIDELINSDVIPVVDKTDYLTQIIEVNFYVFIQYKEECQCP